MSFPYILNPSPGFANAAGELHFNAPFPPGGAGTDPDAFVTGSNAAFYMHYQDANGTDRSAELAALASPGATLTFTQNGNSATYETVANSVTFGDSGGSFALQAYHEPTWNNNAPLTLTQAAGTLFTLGAVVLVSVNETPAQPETSKIKTTGKVVFQGKVKA